MARGRVWRARSSICGETGHGVCSRFVAQEFASGVPREDLFAGGPPLFAARLLVSQAVGQRERPMTLMVLDISCAFLYVEVKRSVYIELLREDPQRKNDAKVGKLVKALYATRNAPQAWAEGLGATLAGKDCSLVCSSTGSGTPPWSRMWTTSCVAASSN